MKKITTYNAAIKYVIVFFCISLSAQNTQKSIAYNSANQETHKRVENYLELKNLGYAEKEIFEDLGNANFLLENYDTAVFWYEKLMETSSNNFLTGNYQERYQYALKKTGKKTSSFVPDNQDWLAMVKADYQLKNEVLDTEMAFNNNYKPFDNKLADKQNIYESPIAITPDGNTAYFSKAVAIKPSYGIFSKKETVYKIYKAHRIGKEWKNLVEVAVCPKHYSALHPAVSNDGKRLFFASDMPGSFGEYDIYVSNINTDGTFGIAKNLGKKVNTNKNDLYPNIVGGNTLFFASEGRKGYGGLDVYMAQVDHKKVGLAVNMGSSINSLNDDYSIRFMKEEGMGYVMSSGGKEKDEIHQIAFSLDDKVKSKFENQYVTREVLNNLRVDYSSSVFEDE